jgi:hypothetical protein
MTFGSAARGSEDAIIQSGARRTIDLTHVTEAGIHVYVQS